MILFRCTNHVLLAAFAPLAAISLRADTLLNETFSPSNERLEQKLPTSAAWFSSDTGSLVVEDRGLTLLKPRVAAIAYFTQEGHPEEGDTLVLEMASPYVPPEASRGNIVQQKGGY